MWKVFHHPDISIPVVRRRIGTELLEMLTILGDVAAHGAWAFLQNRSYPNPRAFDQAVGRLSKQGLIIKTQGLNTPILKISKKGTTSLETCLRPDKWWNKKWNGIWYILMYDVPEIDRAYRNVLRQFLNHQRMGCFQKSVWLTPHDIRPQYSDLEKAASIEIFACLFEAKTVLGMPSKKIVSASWDFDRLFKIQQRFCDVYKENLALLRQPTLPSMENLMRLATEEMDAFRSAFILDPLLPDALLPREYKGKEAYNFHQKITNQIRRSLPSANPD